MQDLEKNRSAKNIVILGLSPKKKQSKYQKFESSIKIAYKQFTHYIFL